MTAEYSSFGRTLPPARQGLAAEQAVARLTQGGAAPGSLLAYGNGRSYGDSCLNYAGLADMRGMNRILAFDPETGIISVEAGTLLSDVIDRAAPYGWFPAVVPGTRFVTIGGAIANDVHGKNHHLRGTFGCHVERIRLLRSDGKVRDCSASKNRELFHATIGGMGLTGLILTADIRLMKVGSLSVVQRVTPFAAISDYFSLAARADIENEYSVAWIDQLAGGANMGRGVLLTANHAEEGDAAPSRAAAFGIPFAPPFTVLNRPFLKLFNTAYRLAQVSKRGDRTVAPDPFFFPLDGIRDWNRLYGPRGLHQHQSVIPFDVADTAIPEMLRASQRAGQGSFLTVLKRFGALRSPALISFPRPGYTLTLDFPNKGESTLKLLDQLDRIAISAGGAINPYKDARMSPATFEASFPDWRKLEAVRDPAFSSAFWERTAGRLRDEGTYAVQAAE